MGHFQPALSFQGLSCIAIIAVIFLVAVVFGIYWTDRADVG